MICLRCGYCCIHLWILTVDVPKKGITEENIIEQGNGTPCKHLLGDKPGEYSCAIHGAAWYKKLGCYTHGQIEKSPKTPCRMGVYTLLNYKRGVFMNNWICPYCKVQMMPGSHSSGECNGWLCPICKHEVVESGSYSLAGRPPIDSCQCDNCLRMVRMYKGELNQTLVNQLQLKY